MLLGFTKRSCGNEINNCVARTSGIENYAQFCIEKSSQKNPFKWLKKILENRRPKE